ncbi:TetR/AcrR family transcriptional regulator [Caulobacter sp. 17J80-11]|uniref:TetR/AcrR family transcriptional regulator n=1 Tax=Caulobacter sp. 17J80-11 TaxID=2763502 RepID=UPI001653B2F6|nr:TetR/AcrR family transcriptional regulator [Caulobacter sp. 17J80-11]MBC6982606.1 TetR/AcrR family transcriptional regulator [Caulobacter sp. 17J80-11]
MPSDPRAPQQARSRETLARLLAASIALLEEKGLAGVTVPEVAARAGVATGSVYRRFTDKDALVRAAFLQLLESAQEANQAALPPERLSGLTLGAALQAITRALVAQYRGRTNLLRALDRYLDQQTDPEFRRRAVDLTEANLRLVVRALLPFRREITAADPDRAITFALLSATTIIEAHKLHKPLLWDRMLPLDDEALASEAAQAMAAYLTRPSAA